MTLHRNDMSMQCKPEELVCDDGDLGSNTDKHLLDAAHNVLARASIPLAVAFILAIVVVQIRRRLIRGRAQLRAHVRT